MTHGPRAKRAKATKNILVENRKARFKSTASSGKNLRGEMFRESRRRQEL